MFSRNLAFIIGINNYTNGISSLKTAVNDAKKLVETLREKYGYQVWVCLDEVATLGKLNQLLEKTLPEQVTENDRLLFYFAGHGVALNGDDGPAGYLIPQDAKQNDTNSYLPMTKLHDALSQLPCRHFLGILDCCFAGAFRWSSTRDLLTTPKVIHKERYDRFITDPAWQIITSSASDQKALDNFKLDTERGQVGEHSPFAAALLKALEGEADCYPPAKNGEPAGDGVITATELYLHLRDTVEIPTEESNLRQTPGIWYLNKHDKGEYIFLSPGHELNLPPAPPLDESKNPYRGLESFDEGHRELFFGRSELVKELQGFVENHPLTIVLGASGSGKSSLVKAGLIPKLRTESTDNKQKYHILSPIRPGETPFQALNNALTAGGLASVELDNQKKNLVQSVDIWTKNNPNRKLLIVIDQVEEIITLSQGEQNEKKRKDFFQQILSAINAHRNQLRVVLTLRSDFEPQVLDAGLKYVPTVLESGNTFLKRRWQSGRFIVPAMTRAELREAIEKPAEARVMYFQPHDLVEEIIDEVDDMPGALPLLSFALSELYLKYLKRQRVKQYEGIIIDRALTAKDYQELGGVIQSLTQRADEEYQALAKTPAYEQVIRHVMLRMVAIGGGELARRRVPLSELEYPPEKNALVKEVVERFTQARLLVEGQDAKGNPYVEPAHDALVRGWKKLLAWKQKEEENLILQRRLTPVVVDWKSATAASHEQKGYGFQRKAKPIINWLDSKFNVVEKFFDKINPGLDKYFMYLWNGEQSELTGKQSQLLWNGSFYLDKLDDTLKSNDNWLNNAEAEFIEESIARKQQNHNWRWRIAIAVMLGLSGLTVTSWISQRHAVRQEISALMEAANGNIANNSNRKRIDGILAAFGAKEKLDNMWFGGKDIRTRLDLTISNAVHNVADPNTLGGHARGINNVKFSPDGKILASSSFDNTVKLWDTKTGKQIHTLIGHTNGVEGVSFSPDGTMLASSSLDNTVKLWNTKTGERIRTLGGHKNRVHGVSFSPDGKMLASASRDRMVKLWDTETGQEIRTLEGHENVVNDVSFSPNGRIIASASRDKTVKLWDTKTGQEIETLKGHKANVRGISFSPSHQNILASVSNDNTVRLWNTEKYGLITKLEGKQKRNVDVIDVSFSADGKTLAFATTDNQVIVRKIDTTNKEFKIVSSPVIKDTTNSISLNPDGTILATSKGRTVKLWNTKTRKPINIFTGHRHNVNDVSFSIDGKILASASADKTIKLWDTSNRQEIQTLKGHKDTVRDVSFSPDGKMLASASFDKTVRLWNLSTGEEIEILRGHINGVHGVSFSPDGKMLASASADRTVRLWNLSTGQVNTLKGHTNIVNDVKFSPDGKMLASASADETVILWNAISGKEIQSLTGHTENVNGVSFSPDSKMLASASDDNMVKLWNFDIDDLATSGCNFIREHFEDNPDVEGDRNPCN